MSLINSTKSNSYSINSNLNSAQGKRLSENKSDFRRSVIFAALAFVAVGSVSYIALQKITATPAAAPVVQAAAETSQQDAALLMALELLLERERASMRQASDADVNTALVAAPAAVVPVAAPAPVAATPAVAENNDLHTTVVGAAPDCYDQVVEAAREATIFYQIGSATLTPTDAPKLRKLGNLVAGCPDALVHVTGHSDASGSDVANMTLSWKRADNIVAAVADLGIDATRFEAVGFGARSPLSQGGASDEDLNRRVEFMIVRNHH